MPEITVTESTFERLQHHAKPFVDTPDMVISRALDVLDAIAGQVVPENGYRIKAERNWTAWHPIFLCLMVFHVLMICG